MILACSSLEGPISANLGSVVVLVARIPRAKGQVVGPVVPQLVLDLLHVLDFVGAHVRARTHRLVILHSEVHPVDRVFAW